MVHKKFLVSVAAAVTALLPLSHNVIGQSASNTASPEPVSSTLTAKPSDESLFQKVFYLIGQEKHILLMRRLASGAINAVHSSHSSHRSHQSHGSHRSGY